MAKVQKTYTAEFKREAVRLAQTSGKPIAQVARELGISDTSIYQWREALAAQGGGSLSGKRPSDGPGGGTAPPQTRAGGDAPGA